MDEREGEGDGKEGVELLREGRRGEEGRKNRKGKKKGRQRWKGETRREIGERRSGRGGEKNYIEEREGGYEEETRVGEQIGKE